MRSILIGALVLVAAACSKREPANGDHGGSSGSAGSSISSPAKGGTDPLGPCTWFADGKCMEHEALFADAVAAAKPIALDAAPVDSGPQSHAGAYFARVTTPTGKRLRVTIQQTGAVPTGGTRFRLRRWWSRVDGWQLGEDAFNTVEPGASIAHDLVPDPGVPLLIAVLADPPADFTVRFSAE